MMTQKLLGSAALLLAVTFPVYWIGAIGLSLDDPQAAYREDFMTLNMWDALFLLIGILEVFVYLGLSNYFKHQINGHWASVLLVIMAVLVTIFHSSLIIDVVQALDVVQISTGFLDLMIVASLVVLFLYSLTLLTLGVVLLAKFPALSSLIKVVAVVATVTAAIQLSVVLSVANIVFFPMLMLVVSFQFFMGDNDVDVV